MRSERKNTASTNSYTANLHDLNDNFSEWQDQVFFVKVSKKRSKSGMNE